jgi:hypothetical protein
MAHLNIEERRKAVAKMICESYTRKDMKALAKEYDTTYTAIYMDIISLQKDTNQTIHINNSIRAKIHERDNYTCQYCGTKDANNIVEHVIPYIMGGVAKEYNLVSSCASCNMKKSSMVIVPNNINVLMELNSDWANAIIEKSDRYKFTHSNWKRFKKEKGLTYKKIAEITGTSVQNVKIMVNPRRKMATWMRALMWDWINSHKGVNYLQTSSGANQI